MWAICKPPGNAATLMIALGLLVVPIIALGQSRKPTRVEAPVFQPQQFEGIFFEDAASLLKGQLPDPSATQPLATTPSALSGDNRSASDSASQDSLAWSKLISPLSLEDLVKGGKLRLDQIVTTPAAFKGGGFVEARKEFSLLAVLFAIIESYPEDVRWKKSAGLARELFTRVAANTKVGSEQVYQEAKKRMLDLGDLIGGAQLAGEAKSETEWSQLIDRVPLMQLLDWAHEKNLSGLVASEGEFQDNLDAVQRYAELIAVLGNSALAEDMPDANDEDYAGFAREMIAQAQQVRMAVQTKDANMARQATAQIGQSCVRCHDNFK